MARSDLLDLCGNFPQMKFIIFTNLEDTPIDDFILDKIPENVACISAVNAITHNDKVIYLLMGGLRPTQPSPQSVRP